MADYWISRDKYFCKYCKIYIADDKPSRTQHETGFRHKGNYERYIRDIYKRGARDQKDKNEEAKEIARIDAAAKAAMGMDGTTPAEEETPVASTSKPPPTVAPKPSDPYANYTTAESLGYKDDVAEKQKEEAELRQKEGTIGEWQKVVKKPRMQPQPPVPTGGLLPVGQLPPSIKQEEVKPVIKEEGEGEVEKREEPAAPKRKGYFTEKQLDTEDDFDPSKIGINLKRKRLTLKEEQALEEKAREAERVKEEHSRGLDGGVGGWAQAEIKEEPMLEFDQPPQQAGEGEGVKQEEDEKKIEKVEEKPATGGGFKKRKMHGAGTTRKK